MINHMGKSFTLVVLLALAILTVECEQGKHHDPGILVSTLWLQDHLSDRTTPGVLHVGTEEGYDTLHIPGARFIVPGDFVVTQDSHGSASGPG